MAQQPGSLDVSFAAVPGTDAAPTLMAPLAGGGLYVGGGFTNYGGTGRARVARLLSNGQVDLAFTLPTLWQINAEVILNGQVLIPASTNLGSVSVLLALPDGRAVIAGNFNHIGATPAPGLALLSLEGEPAVTSFDFEGGEVSSLLVGPAGTFYAGAKGNLAPGRLPLLRFRLDGSRDASFTSPTLVELGYETANPFILRKGPGDTLYAVTAAAVGFTPASDILRLTDSGALDTTFADGGKANIPFASQSSFVTDGSGRMTFTAVNSYRGVVTTRKVNRLTLDGSLDLTFQSTVDPGFGGRVVAAQADGKVLFTGGTAPIRRLNSDGSLDTAYADPSKVPVAQSFLSLTQFALAPDGSLYAAGFTFTPTFQLLNGVYHIFGDPNSAPSVAVQPVPQTNTFGARTRFSVTAQGASPLRYQWFRNGTMIDGATNLNLILEPTTAIDSGAEFHCVVENDLGSKPSDPARLTLLAPLPGAVYRETDFATGTDAEIQDLQFDAAGGLMAVGGFTKFNGTNRVRLARLIERGRLVDPAFDTSTLNDVGLAQRVLPLASGKVLLMGNSGVVYNGVEHRGAVRVGADGRLDMSFNPTGSGGQAGNRFSEGPGGGLLVASLNWNGVAVPFGFGRLSADGVRDPSFVAGPSFTPGSLVLALPDGKALVNGWTNNSSGAASGVIRLDQDGSQDTTFYRGPLPGFSQVSTTALLRQPDGRILVAGTFIRTMGIQTYTLGVIRLLENGQLDPGFNPIPALADMAGFPVQRIALQADGRILIQGAFTRIGGYPRPGVARLWPNGVVDPEFSPGTPRRSYLSGSPLGTVSAMAVSEVNDIFLSGDFHQFDGLPRTNFVQVLGGALQVIPAPPTVIAQPTRVTATAGSSVTFTVEPGGEGPFQFQWRRNEVRGSSKFMDIPGATNASLTLSGLRYTLPTDSGLYQLQVVNPGGMVASQYITLLVEPDPVVPGAVDLAFAPQNVSGLLSSQPQITDAAPNGQLYASLRTTLVRQFEDGTPDPGFIPPADLTAVTDGGIAAVKRQPDGKILIAGRFKEGSLARLLPDGSHDPDFIRTNSYGGFFQSVPWQIGLQSDGRILLAGTFENFSGRPVNGLIRFMPDGSVDPEFPLTSIEARVSNPNRVLPGTVVSLHVLSDDRIYIGGGFSHVQGVPRIGAARLNADGSVDSTFVPPTNGATPLGTVGTMLFYTMGPVTPAGGVYLFGTFRHETGGLVDSAIRLLPDGSIDDSFHVSTDFQINFGTVQRDGKLIVAGQFTRLNGVQQAGFARLNLDGSTDTGFTPTSGFGVGVPLSILPDGKLLAGGTRYFTGSGPELPAGEIGYTLNPAGIELTWPAGYRLQRATQLMPADWQDVATPSPYTVPMVGPGEFFRVVPGS